MAPASLTFPSNQCLCSFFHLRWLIDLLLYLFWFPFLVASHSVQKHCSGPKGFCVLQSLIGYDLHCWTWWGREPLNCLSWINICAVYIYYIYVFTQQFFSSKTRFVLFWKKRFFKIKGKTIYNRIDNRTSIIFCYSKNI